MRTDPRWLAAIVALGLVSLWVALAAGDTEAERIDKLIEQLGSGSFQEREAATKALDAIGTPALEKLRKAAQSDDLEVKRRAADLVLRIEKRDAVTRLLTPKRVHLVYKDTPLKDAVEDFKKKSGYDLVLHDPDNKLTERKVTLDTGETTFWEAFDQLCDKAEVVHTSPQELMQRRMSEMMMEQMRQRNAQQLKQRNAQPPPAAEKDGSKAAPAEKDKSAPKEKQAAKQPPPENKAPAAGKAAVRPLPPMARPGMMMSPMMAGFPGTAPGQLILIDGKAKARPTQYAGSVRIRAGESNQQPAVHDAPVLVQLQVSIEPKFQLRGETGARITKAVDDSGQSLSQIATGADEGGPAPARFGGGATMAMPSMMGGSGNKIILFKKGEKASKTLKELSGTLTLQVLDAPQSMITVTNVLKASGTTVKGKDGGSIKVVEASKTEDGQIKVRLELEMPPNVVPAQNAGNSAVTPVPVILRQAAPGAAVKGPPPQLPVEKPKDVDKPKEAPVDKPKQAPARGEKEQGKEQAAPPPPLPARPAVAAPGIAMRLRDGLYHPVMLQGLTLVDDKGKSILPAQGDVSQPAGAGKVVEYELTFQVDKGQSESLKLIFSGSRTVALTVPFALKDVPLQ